MDDKTLVEALRLCVDKENRFESCVTGQADCPFGETCIDCEQRMKTAAADCIEALTAQLAEKDRRIADLETQHRVEHCESAGYDCEVRGQLAAAVEDLRGLCWCCAHGEKWDKAPTWSNMITCEHIRERGSLAVGGGKAGKDCLHWQWRAAQEAGEGGGCST